MSSTSPLQQFFKKLHQDERRSRDNHRGTPPPPVLVSDNAATHTVCQLSSRRHRSSPCLNSSSYLESKEREGQRGRSVSFQRLACSSSKSSSRWSNPCTFSPHSKNTGLLITPQRRVSIDDLPLEDEALMIIGSA